MYEVPKVEICFCDVQYIIRLHAFYICKAAKKFEILKAMNMIDEDWLRSLVIPLFLSSGERRTVVDIVLFISGVYPFQGAFLVFNHLNELV